MRNVTQRRSAPEPQWNYYVNSPGVLALRTNVDSLKWSWGSAAPSTSQNMFDDCVVRLTFVVADLPPVPDTQHRGKYHYFSGVTDADEVSYERPLGAGRTLRVRMRGLTTSAPEIVVNRDYYRLVKHRFMNLHSPGYILTDIAAFLLLKNGYSPLHCSGFTVGDAGVLVLAPPNTGKTLTTLSACVDHGAGFLAEDLAVTDGSSMFATHWTSTFRYYGTVDTSLRSKLANRAVEAFAPLELLPLARNMRIDELLPASQLVDRSKIRYVAMLERGSECLVEESEATAVRKALNLNRYEFNYLKSPSLVAYEFFNPELAIDEALQTEREIMTSVMSSAQRLTVRSMDAARYAEMILGAVETGA